MGLLELFKQYNFTVEENTTSDKEVSLDPELLGRVFENLLAAYNPETQESARKSTGSFYTPREIVEYMVEESLIAYLSGECGNDEITVRQLVKDDNVPQIDNPEKIIGDLKRIKILDPACGSGAFPMGILLKITDIIEKLTPKEQFNRYETKLEIIKSCIYGIDIQAIAMLICKLRFFISLICDCEKDASKPNFGIIPLPNLETKFVAANSLLPAKVKQYDEDWTQDAHLKQLQKELLDLRVSIFDKRTHKAKLNNKIADRKKCNEIADYIKQNATQPDEQKIATLQARIAQYESELPKYAEDYWVDDSVVQQTLFGEKTLFKRNPNKEKRDELQERIKICKNEIRKEQSKSAIPGFEQAVEEVTQWNPYNQNSVSPFFDAEWMFGIGFNSPTKQGGFDVVIGNPPYVVSSDPVYSNYQTYDCHELYAYFYEMALNQLASNGILSFITASLWVKGLKFDKLRDYLENNMQLIEYVKRGDDVFENVKMPTATIMGRRCKGQWSCSDLSPLTKITAKMEAGQKLLFQISQIQRGLEIGRNDVMNEGDFPCVTGTLVNKYLPHSVKYISKDTLLTNAKDEKYFTNERILLRETGSFLLALYLDEHLYSNRSLYSILITDSDYDTKYVLACLNSSLLQFYYQVKFKAETDLFPKIRIAQAKLLPIPFATRQQQEEVISLVSLILSAKKANPSADTREYEQQIDTIVYKLFDLSPDEVNLIEQA